MLQFFKIQILIFEMYGPAWWLIFFFFFPFFLAAVIKTIFPGIEHQ